MLCILMHSLGYNHIHAEGVAALGVALKHNTALETLL